MGGMGVEEISAKNTQKNENPPSNPEPQSLSRQTPQYSSRVWTPPSHLCIDHDPLKTSFIPPLQHASENHLLHVKKSLSYWIPVTGTDMLTGRRDDFKTNKQRVSCTCSWTTGWKLKVKTYKCIFLSLSWQSNHWSRLNVKQFLLQISHVKRSTFLKVDS